MASLTLLVEAQRKRLAEILGTTAFGIVEVDADHCRVESGRLTVHFYRRAGDWPIDSSLELTSVPDHAVPLGDHLHTWLLLKSRGDDWPAPQPADPLADELARVARALPVVRDEAMLLESLLW